MNCTFVQIEYGSKNIKGANLMVTDKLSSMVAWKSSGPKQENGHEAEVRWWTPLMSSTQINMTSQRLFFDIPSSPLHR